MTEPRTRRRPLTLRKKLLFSVVVTVTLLVGLELLARIIVVVTPNVMWGHKRELMKTLGFPELSEIFVPDRELAWKLRSGLRDVRLRGRFANSQEIDFNVSTGAGGWRRMPRVENPRARVLFLGDSCLFGLGVDDDETIPAVVQQSLDGVACQNASVPGYSSFQGRRVFEQLDADPLLRVVVINFGRNDALVWNGMSDAEQAEQREQGSFLDAIRLDDLMRKVLPEGKPSADGKAATRPRLTDAEYTAQMSAIVESCRRRGAEPIFVIWPLYRQMSQEGFTPKQLAALRLARDSKVRILDLVTLFKRNGGAQLFLDVVHANATGCRLAAGALTGLLRPLISR